VFVAISCSRTKTFVGTCSTCIATRDIVGSRCVGKCRTLHTPSRCRSLIYMYRILRCAWSLGCSCPWVEVLGVSQRDRLWQENSREQAAIRAARARTALPDVEGQISQKLVEATDWKLRVNGYRSGPMALPLVSPTTSQRVPSTHGGEAVRVRSSVRGRTNIATCYALRTWYVVRGSRQDQL
jgi:hypothetical protein